MKEKIKNSLKFLLFISIAISPFLTVTNILGINAFLDSFEKPDCYLCIKNDNYLYGAGIDEQYLILQKSSHPDFNIESNDEIIYFGKNGDVQCKKVNEVDFVNTKTYLINFKDLKNEIISDNQIIGKVIKIIDDNIWNSISINFWDVSIHNLNLKSLI